MAGVSDIEGVLAAIDEFGSCLAAQDLDGTLALLADDPDVVVIPSEGVEAHRARRPSSRSLAASMPDRDATAGGGAIDGSRQREHGHRSSPLATSSSMSRAQSDSSSPTA